MSRSRSGNAYLRLGAAPFTHAMGPRFHRLPLPAAISAVFLGVAPSAYPAPDVAPTDTLEEVTVTAQKVTENLQNVPISIEALGTKKLSELNITGLDEYVEYLPGVTSVKSIGQGGNGIGTTHVYMRGVVSGQDGNHSASQPSVGTYLDEQPVTTIDGALDVHVYDIARVEVLEGPQGTLYGASSEAGTIRIITNKPDPSKFEAGYDIGGETVTHGGQGWVAEGFVNIPLAQSAAVRLVGWDEHDPGYINNVAGTNANAGIVDGNRTFPVWTASTGESLSNASSVNSNYNTSETRGGRAALKLDVGDWTVTPTFMGQSMSAEGFFGYDPAIGPLEVTHFGAENTQDSFTQSALTVEGKVNNFDITYAGSWLIRNQHSIADYSDYSYFYDKYYGSGCLWLTEAGYKNAQSHPGAVSNCYKGTLEPPGSYTEPQNVPIFDNHFTKWSQELRVSTPKEYPVNGTVGLFAQRQVHDIWQDYTYPGLNGNPYAYNPQGLAQSLTVPGLNNNSIWLTDQQRVDRDQAAFAQANWDMSSQWQFTGGFRQFRYDNSLQGFYGYSSAFENFTGYYPGVNACGPVGGTPNPNYQPFRFAPCTNLNADVTATGHTELGRVTYKFDNDHLVYFTYSTGFRPGGVNRVYDSAIHSIYPPYQADYLKNYEFGWKTQWLGETLRWNGAVFWDDWNDFQFSFLGPNSVTVVQNAPSARIRGVETNAEWRVGGGWQLSGSATFIDAKLTSNFCGDYVPNTLQLSTSCPNQLSGKPGTPISFADGSYVVGPYAPAGTRLPVVPRFKANLVARYNVPFGDWNGFGQAAYVYQDSSVPLLFPAFYEQGNNGAQHLGELPPYSLTNLSAGLEHDRTQFQLVLNNAFNVLGELTRFANCTPTTCNAPYVIPVQPRTFWVKVGQRF